MRAALVVEHIGPLAGLQDDASGRVWIAAQLALAQITSGTRLTVGCADRRPDPVCSSPAPRAWR